jgi:hypothetical protein
VNVEESLLENVATPVVPSKEPEVNLAKLESSKYKDKSKSVSIRYFSVV